jgi:tRNA dimethylallyltransferase
LNAPDAALPALVVVLGPTGVGKTATAVRLCRDFRGEIISADSRQIYRSMDIGTAKPSPQERAAAPHHLIDIVEPDQTLGLAEFQAMAAIAIAEVLDKGHVPFLVGGTGQWIRAIVQGWGVPQVPPDAQLRARLEDEANRAGAERDPAAAARIDHRNVRRVIRALKCT